MIEPASVGLMTEFPDIRVKGFDMQLYNRRFIEGNVIIDARAKEIYYPPHWCALSIKCAFNGKEYYKSNNAHYAVDDGNFLIFNEGKVYSSWIDSSNEVQSYTLNIAPKFEREALHAITSPARTLMDDPTESKKSSTRFTEKLYPHDSLISPILAKIRELAPEKEKNQERLNEMFYFLLEQMTRLQNQTHASIEGLDKLRPATRVELYQRLTRAKDYMYSCYDKAVTLEQTAGVACLNQFYFLRQFRKAFGVTPHQFLTRRRVSAAAAMLEETDKSISDVCSAIGFSDPASFSKLFKKVHGESPTQYRGRTVGKVFSFGN